MSPFRKIAAPILVIAAVVSACGDSSEDAGGSSTTGPTTGPTSPTTEPTSPTTEPTSPTTEPTSPTTEPPDVSTTEPQRSGDQDHPPEVTAAIGDLAATLDVDPIDIELVTFEQVTWPNGALGCPQPDRSYTQALVDGFRVELSAGGVTYWYHGGHSGVPFLCENPEPPVDGGRSDT